MEGYRACSFMVFTVMHLAEALLFSHSMLVGILYWFHTFFLSHLMSLGIWGLRNVEVQVSWITEDHGSVLECWRLVFVSLKFT